MEQLEKEYQQYLKENKDMNLEQPEVYQQPVTFNEWIHTTKSDKYLDYNKYDDLPF